MEYDLNDEKAVAMSSHIETLFYIIFILSPLLVVVNAFLAALFLRGAINFFPDSIITRLCKVIFLPLLFTAYVAVYFTSHFDFHSWFGVLWSEGGWHELPLRARLMITGPAIAAVIYGVADYVWGGFGSENRVMKERDRPKDRPGAGHKREQRSTAGHDSAFHDWD